MEWIGLHLELHIWAHTKGSCKVPSIMPLWKGHIVCALFGCVSRRKCVGNFKKWNVSCTSLSLNVDTQCVGWGYWVIMHVFEIFFWGLILRRAEVSYELKFKMSGVLICHICWHIKYCNTLAASGIGILLNNFYFPSETLLFEISLFGNSHEFWK